MSVGIYYNDLLAPFTTADQAAVTLAATNKALYPAGAFPSLGANFFNIVGRALRIRVQGAITTGTTPGNGQFGLYWGSGADATGTLIASTAAFALTASQTGLNFQGEIDIHCRALGASGSLKAIGNFEFNTAVVASTLQPLFMPASLTAPVTADLTANNVLSLQFLRSGSTVETMQIQNLQVIALN